MGLQDGCITPFFKIFLERVEAVSGIEFLIEGKAAFGMTDSFLSFGLEKDFKDVDHTAGIEDGAMFGEEFAGDGGKAFLSVFTWTTTGLSFCWSIVHYTIMTTRSTNKTIRQWVI